MFAAFRHIEHKARTKLRSNRKQFENLAQDLSVRRQKSAYIRPKEATMRYLVYIAAFFVLGCSTSRNYEKSEEPYAPAKVSHEEPDYRSEAAELMKSIRNR